MMEKPTLKEALKFWTKLGFISFGGPAGQIAIMHEFLVVKKKWISDSKFLHALNYCMILPGPEAQQLATYTGWMLHSVRGGLLAGLLFILPSMFILLGLSTLYVLYGNLPWMDALFDGLKPAVIAIVVLALIKIAKKSLLSSFHYVIAILAFVGIYVFNTPFPLIVVFALVLAFLIQRVQPQWLKYHNKTSLLQQEDEHDYFINKHTVVSNKPFKLWSFLQTIGVSFLFWILPFIAFYCFTSDFKFWQQLSLFFTKAAFVTFGGAYAVLPYVAQVSVEQFNWLSNLQMLDGLALGETTPGPLVMVLVFVGFMAGYNHFGGSIAMGSLALLTTTFFTFLPCFLFILVGAPLIEKTQENNKVKALLAVVTAAVVGVILNLTIYLGKAVLIKNALVFEFDYVALIWVFISIIAMYRLKIGMISWIGISAAFGLLLYMIGAK